MEQETIEQLALKAYNLVIGMAGRARAVARVFFIVAVVTGLTGFVLGLIALPGRWRLAWLVIGGGFAVVGIGAGWRSSRSLTSVLDQAESLKQSFNGLIASIGDIASKNLDGVDVDSLGLFKRAKLSRTIRKAATESFNQYRDVGEAFAAVSSFPGLVLMATFSIVGFSVLTVLFGVALLF